MTDVRTILDRLQPSAVVLQDRREWEGKTAGPGFDQRERFTNVGVLGSRPDIFKLTVLKDAQYDGGMHMQTAQEIGCHGWVCYYHPRIVKRLAPYVRQRHLVRTWHSVDSSIVPPYDPRGREGCLLSGALSAAYPWREYLAQNIGQLRGVARLKHPGYHRRGCDTPTFLRVLSRYKVAIVTCSQYGYALRKLVEATACGCRVLTNLPEDDRVPEIDENLVRVDQNISLERMRILIEHHLERYDAGFQQEMAERACRRFDFRETGRRLAADIEALRSSYQ